MKQCTKCQQTKSLKLFNLDKSSKDGHQRYCIECKKQYRLDKLEHYKSCKKDYYEVNKIEINKRRKIFRENNKTKIAEQKKRYREANKDQLSIKNKRYKAANKEHIKLLKIEYYTKNKGEIIAKVRKRKLAKLSRTPAWLGNGDKFEMECIYTYANALNSVGLQYHVDHIKPLQGETVSGLHVPTNLQVITAEENLQKRNYYNANQAAELSERKRIQIDTKTNRVTCQTE